ncbi:MAG: hypothetical protein ABEH35_06170 [Haloarculaceae archaeon]
MSGQTRCWLVERDYAHEDLVTLVYATRDGRYHLTKQLSANLLFGSSVTAAIEVADDRLEPVDDSETRERYASEARRMADQHDPDDEL